MIAWALRLEVLLGLLKGFKTGVPAYPLKLTPALYWPVVPALVFNTIEHRLGEVIKLEWKVIHKIQKLVWRCAGLQGIKGTLRIKSELVLLVISPITMKYRLLVKIIESH